MLLFLICREIGRFRRAMAVIFPIWGFSRLIR
jgi:hypothetical protein